ncbi:MAG: valine--tRNA ligase [Bacteroidia bacterium]|nr:valine--tRNA ligase [Bacteroidia bacterium]
MAISKNYTPSEIEDKWYAAWIEAGAFRSVPDHRPAYTITIPPPNVTGILHMGHILNNTIQDVLIRRKRMEGYNACWVPGTDHASIATEAKVVRMLAEQGIRKSDLTREEFLRHSFEWKETYGGIILRQLRKLGASCDWERTHFTMDEEYSRAVIECFCELYRQGLIYRGKRMVNWDPQAQTAVSDEEVIHRETQGFLYHIRYAIEGAPGEYVVIATTRPETLLGDTAVAIHPEDPRYTHLHGRRALVPLAGRSVPIILDAYVDREFGTGCLKVTPAHDMNDAEIGLRHGLEVVDMMTDEGRVSEAGGAYAGLDRFEARKQIVRDLEAQGLLERQEPYTHSVGYSERTNAVIEPRRSLQWFLKMQDLSRPALDAVNSGEVNLIPGRFLSTYRHWLEHVRDWCLSRQLWWGHRIPAYYIAGTGQYVVAPDAASALEAARELTGNPDLQASSLEQDPDVLDTWASSWLWPVQVFQGITRPGNPDFSYYYPTSDLVTAPEILFFWVARMIIAGYHFTGKKPFTNVYLTGIVRDDQRRKMSKQLGNSPDPLDLIAKHGADGVRVGMLLASPAGNDLLYKESLIEQGRNFANKLWNAYRLVGGWQGADREPGELELLAADWMRARLAQAAQELEDLFGKFRIADAVMAVYKLTWDDFCSWFLEMIKPAGGQPLSAATLEAVTSLFEGVLELLHPFMPFVTEEIWQGLREREAGVFLTCGPMRTHGAPDTACLEDMALIQETVTALRALRSEKGLGLKDALPLSVITETPDLFRRYLPVLQKLAGIGGLEFVQSQPARSAGVRVRTSECFLPAGELADAEEERSKLLKEIEYTEGFLRSVLGKLENERFVSSAPAQVVENERRKRADAEAKLDLLRRSLAALG